MPQVLSNLSPFDQDQRHRAPTQSEALSTLMSIEEVQRSRSGSPMRSQEGGTGGSTPVGGDAGRAGREGSSSGTRLWRGLIISKPSSRSSSCARSKDSDSADVQIIDIKDTSKPQPSTSYSNAPKAKEARPSTPHAAAGDHPLRRHAHTCKSQSILFCISSLLLLPFPSYAIYYLHPLPRLLA